ncbi:putative peptide n-glycanase [Tribonema minus]|uniref:Putative peptide n-glycanase n=1 Tax=Tribonema minus TaxID=303371 RepID=A0A836CB71_9STRA|nr:putative peptide n-glycanase [Tribonema minus]
MAAKYPEAIWCKVWEHQCRELIMSCGVRSFPTFHFYVSGNKVDEMSGARGQQLEQKVQHWLSVAGPQRTGPVTVKVKFVRERVRESGTGKILVSEEAELEVDPSDGLDVLQFQILSITDIEVDEQLITGGPDDQPVSVRSDADLKKALSLGGGGMYGNYPVLRVKKGQAPPPYVPPPSYGTAQLASAAAWRDCCSAVFFGDEALLQPAWQVREAAGEQKDDAALHLVCHACASRCFGPAAGGTAAAALAPGASSVVPFACEGKELLSHGPVAAKRAMADALEAAGVEAQLQGAGAQGMPSFVSRKGERNIVEGSGFYQLRPLIARALKFIDARRIDGVLRCVRAYEDPAAQAKAQAVMPMQVLQAAHSQGGDEAVCRALLHWFKHDFFQWVNKPACDVCQCSDTESRDTAPPTPHERDTAWASEVEVYRCTRCAATTRFPRIHNPSALLDTRRGRCGEWANCFTLCCRAAGLHARYVLDWTDHVWTEIWLSGQWTHADSCEDKLDSPLMYEHGWGKQLTYIVAAGTEGVLDVTPRYTRRWRHVACRRTLVPARGLAQELANINLKIRTALAPPSREQAEAAEAVETAELQAMCLLTYDAERPKSDEAEGRISGDRAWVASRGEDGGMCAAGNVPLPQAGASLSIGAMTLAAVTKGPAAAAVAAICCSSGTLLFCGTYGTGSGVSSFEQLQSDLAALPEGALIAAAAARGDNTLYLRSALAAAISSTAVPLSTADDSSDAQPASSRTWVLLGAAGAHVPWARVNCGYSSAPVAAALELAVPQTAQAAAAAAASGAGGAAQSDASALLVDTALALPLLQLPPLDLGAAASDAAAAAAAARAAALAACAAVRGGGGSGSSSGTALSYCPGQPVLIGEVCGSGGAVHAPGWSTTLLPESVGVDGAAARGALPQGDDRGVWRVVETHDATGSAHDDTIAFSDADTVFPAVGADGGAAAAVVLGGSIGGALLPLPHVVEILGWASDAHVNGVQLHYRIGTVRATGVRHLGDHGTYRQSAMMLNDGEGVASVDVRAGLLVDQVTVTTTKGRSHTWGSALTESPLRSYSVPDGHTFLGFSGGVGGHLHSLGIITVSESETLAAAAAADADMPRFAAAVPLLYSADPARRAVAALMHLSADGGSSDSEAAAAAARIAAETALKYAANVLRDAAKFSRIRAGNAVFAAKIGSVRGGPLLLRALGFELESAQAATSTVAAAQAGVAATAMTCDAFYVFDPRQRSVLAARCASMRAALADLNFDP